MKLSIITPYYNTYEYTKKLADSLVPQLREDVEWIIVDDGCLDRRLDEIKTKVVHLAENSGNPSVPRNVGLFYATGEYIAFIDSDDDVTPNYVEKIMEKIKEGFDYCYISWKATNGAEIIIEKDPPEWNNSVWKCVYRREKINNLKFDPIINYGEDKDFNAHLPEGEFTSITEPIYIYTVGRDDSLTSLLGKGLLKPRKDL